MLPSGWQYPEITASRIRIADNEYLTDNYKPSPIFQCAERKTSTGTAVTVEVVYLTQMPDLDEGPFLKEERELIDTLADIIKVDLERRERKAELKDYKYALDISSIVSISKTDGTFSFVNENFCKISQYTFGELIGQSHRMLWSGLHTEAYFDHLSVKLKSGLPFRGEFCNKAKDGSLYWVESVITPFLDENKKCINTSL